MRGVGKRGRHCGLVADFVHEASIAGRLRPHDRRGLIRRPFGFGDGGDGIPSDLQCLGRILGLFKRVGEDSGHRIAGKLRALAGERPIRRFVVGRAVRRLALHLVGEGAEVADLRALAGQDEMHARARGRCLRVDREDARGRMRRAHHKQAAMAGWRQVAGIAAQTAEEAGIFGAGKRFADKAIGHGAGAIFSLLNGSAECGLATPGGLEPPTFSLEGCCSIRLSYGAIGAGADT